MADYPNIIVPPPGPKARAIVERDEAWTSTCYIKEYPLVVSRGQGVMVEDVDGNRYLDFIAGIAVCSTGYGHPKVVAAVKDAADRFLHICGSDFYYEGMAALCERLARIETISVLAPLAKDRDEAVRRWALLQLIRRQEAPGAVEAIEGFAADPGSRGLSTRVSNATARTGDAT